jgi:hypothetical protein
VRLAPDWNHAWYVAWEILPKFPGAEYFDARVPTRPRYVEVGQLKIVWPPKDESSALSQLQQWLDYIEYWGRWNIPAGFFGLDQNCEWHWIGPSDTWPYHGALDAASIRLKVGEDGEAQLVEYTVFADVRAHCRSFLKNIHRLPAVYDLESHTFIIQCPDE